MSKNFFKILSFLIYCHSFFQNSNFRNGLQIEREFGNLFVYFVDIPKKYCISFIFINRWWVIMCTPFYDFKSFCSCFELLADCCWYFIWENCWHEALANCSACMKFSSLFFLMDIRPALNWLFWIGQILSHQTGYQSLSKVCLANKDLESGSNRWFSF